MKSPILASFLAAGLMSDVLTPMIAAQNAYSPQLKQLSHVQYVSDHRKRNKRIKHGVIGGAIGAGAGALIGGGPGAAIGAVAGGAAGALWPAHHHNRHYE
ncbi:MAG TPA: YMGG-like glycine zipper-containing protein [Bryobacteraceae bacterium]|nr:YMGG-like glycine zipper-containing protein [Bryobacteraceae bacterium]